LRFGSALCFDRVRPVRDTPSHSSAWAHFPL